MILNVSKIKTESILLFCKDLILSYKDKSDIAVHYRIIILTSNFFSIMEYSKGTAGHFDFGVTESSLTFGTVQEIIDKAPEYLGFKMPLFVSEKSKVG